MGMKELKKQIDMYKNEKEELNNMIQSEKKNASILQENYNKLLSGSEMSDDTKNIIIEKDKAVKKSNLLTDKCKKLISKCKQQENQIKEQEKTLSKQKEESTSEIDHLKEELAVKASDYDEKSASEQKHIELYTQANQEIHNLKETVLQNESEKQQADNKWQSEIKEKDNL